MANEQAWKDYGKIVSMLIQSEYEVKEVARCIERLKGDKVEIFDNPVRKAEFKKVVDVHYDHTITNLTTRFTKLKDLLTHLESNGYI